MDLGIVFYYIFEENFANGCGACLITNNIMNAWENNISVDTLYDIAIDNINLLGCEVIHVSDFMCRMARMNDAPELYISQLKEAMSNVPMHIVTNDYNMYGASLVFFNKNICKQLAKNYDDDLYIMPASIHETIIVPVSSAENTKDIKDLVKSANKNDVRPEDLLSDSVYMYSRETAKISIVA